MRISDLVSIVEDSAVFARLDDYTSFCRKYLEFVESGLQAVIVAQNETDYNFYQYKDDGYYNVTRPINSKLMYTAQDIDTVGRLFPELLRSAGEIRQEDDKSRAICDVRPNMHTDPFLSRHIKSIDHLFCSDLQAFLENAAPAEDVTILKETSAALDYDVTAGESQPGFIFS